MSEIDSRAIVYAEAKRKMGTARTKEDYQKLMLLLQSLGDYQDCPSLLQQCEADLQKDLKYQKAFELLNPNTVESCTEAVRILEEIPQWRNADERRQKIQTYLERLQSSDEVVESFHTREKELKTHWKNEELRKKKWNQYSLYAGIAATVLYYICMFVANGDS